MAMTFTQSGKRRQSLAGIMVPGTLAASDSYATGGDAVDFRQLGSIYRAKDPYLVIAMGKAGFVYQYDYANRKMLVFCNTAGGANAALGEHTAAAYAAGVSGDTIKCLLFFDK